MQILASYLLHICSYLHIVCILTVTHYSIFSFTIYLYLMMEQADVIGLIVT